MKELAQLLVDLRDAGVVLDYALFGAVAQMRYTEAVSTRDVDVLVLLPSAGLDLLSPIYAFCAGKGYAAVGEAIQVGDWPVQFIPAFSFLTEEAVREAEASDLDGVPVRVVSAAHLAAMALSVGRAKDHSRIVALIEAGATSAARVQELAARHGLSARWDAFVARFPEVA